MYYKSTGIKNWIFHVTDFLLVQYVIGHALKGHICPASQIASHMQFNPGVHKGSLSMACTTTVTLEANGAMTPGQLFATLYKSYAFSCYLDCYLDWIFFR